MIELHAKEFPRVLPLYLRSGQCFPLISAVLQQKQPGQVFVDALEDVRSALVVTHFGFTLFLGNPSNESFNAALQNALSRTGIVQPSYLLWYAPPREWSDIFGHLPDGTSRSRERIRYRFDAAAYTIDVPQKLPVGFELKAIDRDLLAKAEKLNLEIGSRFWASVDAFLKEGCGFCVINDAEIVSLCYSACVVDGLAEIDIITDPAHRNKGFALLVARGLIAQCLKRQIQPTWDCFSSNMGSQRLAVKLGFKQEYSYQLRSFTIPLQFQSDHLIYKE